MRALCVPPDRSAVRPDVARIEFIPTKIYEINALMVTVVFPSQFGKLLEGKLTCVVNGTGLSEVLKNICRIHAQLDKHLFLDSGKISPFIAFAIDGDPNIYTSAVADSVILKSGSHVEIVLPMAGG